MTAETFRCWGGRGRTRDVFVDFTAEKPNMAIAAAALAAF
jgi:hypothetical protein